MAAKVSIHQPYPYFVPRAEPSHPLIFAVASRDWSTVLARLETAQGLEEAKTVDLDGWFPLHHACAAGSALPENVLLALLNAYPQGARVPEQHGELPIEIACGAGARDEVVNALAKAYPRGARRDKCNMICCGQ